MMLGLSDEAFKGVSDLTESLEAKAEVIPKDSPPMAHLFKKSRLLIL